MTRALYIVGAPASGKTTVLAAVVLALLAALTGVLVGVAKACCS